MPEPDLGDLSSFKDLLIKKIKKIAKDEYQRIIDHPKANDKVKKIAKARGEKYGKGFPKYAEILSYLALEGLFQGKVKASSLEKDKAFPDIDVGDFGFEVKSSAKAKRTRTNGNSTLQDDPELDQIYCIWFVKNVAGIHVGRYEDFIESIGVTHGPRFKLALDTNKASFHDYHKMSLEAWLGQSKILRAKQVKSYLIDNDIGKPTDWWRVDPLTLNKLVKKSHERWKVKFSPSAKVRIPAFSQIPEEVFLRRKWEEVEAWLIKEYECIPSCSVKDQFTAGGKGDNGEPAVWKNFKKDLEQIREHLEQKSLDLKEWKKELLEIVKIKTAPPGESPEDASNDLTPEQAATLISKIEEL